MEEQENEKPRIHIAVMPSEVLEYGEVSDGQTWVDGTAGAGGHSRLLSERVGSSGRVVALDRDPSAAEDLCKTLPSNCSIFNESYHRLPEVLAAREIESVDGVLLDLGLSSDQLADEERGFSFQFDGPLDMRFDPTMGISAAQWLSQNDEKTIADTIYQYGEERFSRRIARKIVEQRRTNPIRTAAQLRELIVRCVPQARKSTKGTLKHGRVDPATRTFQALRIVVNQELKILEDSLRILPSTLSPGGKFLIISFHSLEDRLVKNSFREDERLEVITKRPLTASDREIGDNPRSRSAKLRVAQKRSGDGQRFQS